jgi:cytochrome c oxidase subunit 2
MPHGSVRKVTLMALAALGVLSLAACATPQSTFSPASDVADNINTIYVLVVTAATIVGFLVLVAMAYLIIRFRARPGGKARQIHGSKKLEIAWTLLPAGILLIIAIPVMFFLNATSQAAAADAVQVEAIGHQWWFEFRYPGLGPDGKDLVTANELVLPIGQQAGITLHSVDVLHSFWVPALAGKTDMVPGRTNHLSPFTPNELGTFYGQCAEFCGTAHALMRFRVKVVSLGEFEQWVAAHNAAAADPAAGTAAARGWALFQTQGCSGCHTINGVSAGTFGPNLTLFGERSTVAAGILESTQENVAQWIHNVQSVKPLPVTGSMPSYKDTLTDAQAMDLAAYLKSLTVN